MKIEVLVERHTDWLKILHPCEIQAEGIMVVNAFDEPWIEPEGKKGDVPTAFVSVEKFIDQRECQVCPSLRAFVVKPAVDRGISELVECSYKLFRIPSSS